MVAAIVTFFTLIGLQFLVGQVNHGLSPYQLHLFAGGLFITYAALMMRTAPGLAASILGGLLCDSTTPVRFGTHTLLFVACHAVIHHTRKRIPREETVVRVVVAAAANLVLFLGLTFVGTGAGVPHAPDWSRLGVDLACSQAALILIAPWFFAVQASALALVGRRPLTPGDSGTP